jgi:hypothetical protein
MNRLALLLLVFCVVSVCAIAQVPDPQGVWAGAIDAGGTKLRLVMRVAKNPAGGYTTKIDSPDQGTFGLPVEKTTATAEGLQLELPNLGASYDAKYSMDGKSLSGQWSQGGNIIALTLTRTTEEAVAQKPQAKGQPLTPEQRRYLIAQLEKSLSSLKAATAGVSPAQASFKASPDKWSITEVVEHLGATEEMLFGYATQGVMKIPTQPELASRTPEQLKANDEQVMATTEDRSRKAQAVEPLRPKDRYATLDEAVAALVEKRGKTIEYVKVTEDDLRFHATPGQNGAFTDVYDYLLMLASHANRHTAQIIEVKSSEGYPKQ